MRRLALLFGVLALWLGLAPPAVAGGPTSVLLVNQATMRAAGIQEGSADYRALDAALGALGGGQTPEAVAGVPNGPDITLSWLSHETHVWRVDRLYPDAKGGMLVHRRERAGLAGEGVWFRAAHAKEAAALLGAHGLLDKGFPAASSLRPAVAESAAPAPPGRAASASAATGWWWSLPGLAAGAALARAAFLRRGGPRTPRRELVDA
ncbi:hypothetical protein ACFQLX_04260 [Streptomyces polyrhachis]|uniref:Uncharacterized protein n=1 Tax=Streptomyces polyrhachis TaxID=1282885 RepID=A0ABW2G9C1_9ACTN